MLSSFTANELIYLRTLQIANRADIAMQIDELAAAIKQETSLIYRLLRYPNSPVFLDWRSIMISSIERVIRHDSVCLSGRTERGAPYCLP
jgi:hypothetical protein